MAAIGRGKAIAGVAVLLAVFAGIAMMSSGRLAGMADAAAATRKASFHSVQTLGQIQYDMMRYRQLEAARSLARTPEADEREAALLAVLRAQVDADLQRYRAVVVEGEARSLADRLVVAWNRYLALDPKLMDLSVASGADAAHAFYAGEMRTLFNDMVGQLNLAFGIEAAAARETEDASALLYSRLQAMTIGAMLSVLALAAVNILYFGSTIRP